MEQQGYKQARLDILPKNAELYPTQSYLFENRGKSYFDNLEDVSIAQAMERLLPTEDLGELML
jgi:hypothetical protein